MLYTTIIYETTDHIAQITLNRPEANNAINEELARELGDICQIINQDEDIRLVVITGAGDKAFSSGSDLRQLIHGLAESEIPPRAELEDIGKRYSVATAIAGIDRPVIAAINGDALGQGLELALGCDIRIASDEAHFGFPHTALGLTPMDGGTQRLPRIVGKGKALEMVLTAETMDAQEAQRIGLVNRVVPKKELIPEVEKLARGMAARGPIALRFAREAVNKGLDLTLEQGLRLEADLYFLLHTTEDRTEGITAFLEKRLPQFNGQ